MPPRRVILRAEQEGRSFAWRLSGDLAEKIAIELRDQGWTVTIEPDPEESDDGPTGGLGRA
jgi:hypothetical protein